MSVLNLNWYQMKYYRTFYMRYYETYLEILLLPFVKTNSKLIFFPKISEKEEVVLFFSILRKGIVLNSPGPVRDVNVREIG